MEPNGSLYRLFTPVRAVPSASGPLVLTLRCLGCLARRIWQADATMSAALLDSSLRALAAELKRNEGFTSWLTGSTQHTDVKSALDAAVAKLRDASKEAADDVRSARRCSAPPEAY